MMQPLLGRLEHGLKPWRCKLLGLISTTHAALQPVSRRGGRARSQRLAISPQAGLSAAKRKRARIDGRSLGYGTAFSAVAPSQRPVCDAHQSKNIRERYSDRVSPGPEYLDA